MRLFTKALNRKTPFLKEKRKFIESLTIQDIYVMSVQGESAFT